LEKLVEILDYEISLFDYEVEKYSPDYNFVSGENVLLFFRKQYRYTSYACNCFMKEMCKIDMYKNIKLIANKNQFGYWKIYITCNIEYP